MAVSTANAGSDSVKIHTSGRVHTIGISRSLTRISGNCEFMAYYIYKAQLPVDMVKTSLQSFSHCDKLSAARTCSMLVSVSWISFCILSSVSVSSMANRTPGRPDSGIRRLPESFSVSTNACAQTSFASRWDSCRKHDTEAFLSKR